MRLKDMIDMKKDKDAFAVLLEGIEWIKDDNLTYKGKKAYKFSDGNEEVTFFINAHKYAQVVDVKIKEDRDMIKRLK